MDRRGFGPKVCVRTECASRTLERCRTRRGDSRSHLAWSGERTFQLADRHDRQRAYEIVLREGGPEDIERYVDGPLLVDSWNDLFLPKWIRVVGNP